LLGRLPRPPRHLRKKQRLIMQDDPTGPHAEAFRILRTNFELANFETEVRTVMLTSAVEKEGKSTTVANLALVLARAGRRVTLVDLDLRSASLHRFLGLDSEPGVTDVALGDVPLAGTAIPVDLGGPAAPRTNLGGYGLPEGSLHFLPVGSLPSNPGEFIARLRLAPILDELEEKSDIVLIDGPPLLRVGDAIAASSGVDALVVVTRLNVVRAKMLDDLSRVLRSCPAAKLGVIVAGADVESGYGYLTYPYEHRKAVA
jgi:tyrosine-protein kinase